MFQVMPVPPNVLDRCAVGRQRGCEQARTECRAGRELLSGPAHERPRRSSPVRTWSRSAYCGPPPNRGCGRVPENLSVTGYDNTAVAACAPVRLNSADPSCRTMGAAAGRQLLSHLAGQDASERFQTPARLPPRATTGPPSQPN